MNRFKSPLILLGFFVLMVLYLEFLFKTRLLYFEFRFNYLFTMDILRNILFTITYGLFVVAFLKIFKRRVARRFYILFMLGLIGLYFSQDIYYAISNNFFSFSFTSDIAKGFTFFYRLPQSLSWGHALYFLPIIGIIIFLRYERENNNTLFDIRYDSLLQPVGFVLIATLSLFLTAQTISAEKSDEYLHDFSDYDLYREPLIPHAVMRKFGLLSYARLDIQSAFRRDIEEPLTLDDFYENNPSYIENEMSGIFEDKNFILIMAEALEPYAIDPDLSPNLYRLLENSWYFDEFYAPLYYRNTADTEFMVQTGFYPNKNVQLSMSRYADNYFPNTLPRLFRHKDYTAYAFHNFSDHFYPREEFHPNTLGYNRYFGPDALDLVTPLPEEREARGHYWHSDLEMFQNGLPHLLEEDQFFGYFLTVTGHLPYEADRHDYALKHYDTIQEILESTGREDIDESLKYYHASQWEFDLAIGYLIDKLEEENRLDDTVIAIFGDHYAYGLRQEVIWEYDHQKGEEIPVNIHKVPLIVYHQGLEAKTYSQTFSTVDLLPTFSNMFNLNLDYQQILGQDAFNGLPNTVILSSTSFITDEYYYEVERDIFVLRDGSERLVDPRPFIGEVYQRILINNYLLENDVFRQLTDGARPRNDGSESDRDIYFDY